MCGRYLYSLDNKELREIAEEAEKNLYSEQKLGDIYPSNVAPILISDKIEIKSILAKWGLKSSDNKGIIINARLETLTKKPTFRKLVDTKKCIVPAYAFYEWKDNIGRSKEKYIFKKENEVIYMAGIYDIYEPEENKQLSMFDNEQPKKEIHFSIITKDANASVKEIHHRMPLILGKDEIKKWLMSDNIDDIIKNNNVKLKSEKI